MRLDSPNVVGTLTLDVVNNNLGDVLTVTSNVVTKRTIAQFLGDLGGVPITRSILAGTGLTGGGSLSVDRTLSLTGQALSFHNLNTTGLVVRTGTDTITTRTLVAGNNITITNADGLAGNPVISLADSTFTQDEQVFDYTGSANFTLTGVTTPYNVEVFLNGQRLVKTLDWTIAGNVVTVTAPLDTVLPDEITITYFIKVPDTAPIGLSGSGTTNYVTKWGTSSTLTASTILDNGSLVDIQNNLRIGTTLSTISYNLPLSISLPAVGTKCAFLNIGINSIVKVELNGSENGFYQPITLTIVRNSIGTTISIIKDNPFLHTHSNDILFSSDTATGNIFAERTLSTTRLFRISKVEILFGTGTVLNGSSTTTGGGADQSITRVGAALYVTGVNTVAQGNITASSFIRTGGTSSQFLKGDGSVDTNVYGLSNADITAASLTTTTLTLTRAAGNLTASVPTWNQDTTGSARSILGTTVTDLNTVDTSALFFRYNRYGTGATGTPLSLNNANGLITFSTHSDDQFAHQLAFPDNNTNIYIRRKASGIWGSWRQIFHDDYHPNADVLTTARTLTIGSTGKTFDGSANVSWSLAEIGAGNVNDTVTAVSLTTTTLTLTRASGNLTASVPTFNQNTTGTAAGLSATLVVGSGGTGATTLTGVVIGNGTSAMTGVAGTASQLLRRNAGNTAYEFFTHDFVNQAGARSSVSLTTTGTSGAATYSSATGVFNIPNYTYTHPAYTTRSITATGASVLSTFTSDATGHVTGITTRTLTAADIGALAASSVSGTSTYIAKFTGASTLGNSIITDNGTLVSVLGSFFASSNIISGGQIASTAHAKGNSGTGTVTFNWDEGNVQTVTLTGNCTFAFSNPQSGASYQIIITQDATGGRTITWPTIHWEGKTVPTLTGTLNSKDIVTFTYDGTNYNGVIAKNFGTP